MIRRIVRYLLRRSSADADLDEEVRVHLAMERQRRIEAGESVEAAEAAALKDFGNITMVKEVTREMWGWTWLDNLWQDMRYGARLLRLSPTFTAVAALSLALGIGANTAIFQLLDAVRLRSLPVARPHELAEIRIAGGNHGMGLNPGRYGGVTRPMWEELRRHQQAFTGVLAWNQADVQVGQGSEVRRAKGIEVSGEFFQVLGVPPWRGRLIQPEDEADACPATRAALSYGFWQSEGAPDLRPGGTLYANGHLYEVIGVTPPGFSGVVVGEKFDLAFPFCRPTEEPRRDVFALSLLGRLRPGWTLEQASAHLDPLSGSVMEATAIQGYNADTVKRYKNFRLTATPGASGVSALREDYDSSLWLLLGITALVLLIACANLASLMLARSSAREREIAVRLALGASRGRLLRQLTSESALLAAIGAGLGVGIAQVLSRVLVASLSTESNPIHLTMILDWRVLLFAGGAAIVTCVVFGALPALRVTRLQPEAVMRAGGRGLTAGRQIFAMQRTLVIAQIAISLVLLVGALLFVRSFRKLITFNPGLRQKGVSVAFVGLQRPVPKDRLEGFQRELLDEVRAIPGVRNAGSTTNVPLLGASWTHGIAVGAVRNSAKFTWVSPGYFETMGVPLLAGRMFDQTDTGASKRVAIVNQTFVRVFCDGSDPLGQTLRTGAEPGYPSTVYEIVGVIPDTRYDGLRTEIPAMAFAPGSQFPGIGPWAAIMMHADIPSAGLASSVRRRLAKKFPDIIVDFADFQGRIHDGLVRERMLAILSGLFGGLAAILAVVGLYGVLSYFVARRRNEIGIRVALGARQSQVVAMVMRDAGRSVVIGIAFGVGFSFIATRGVGALLFGLKPNDPVTLVAAAGLMAAIAAAASLIPARRAAKLDPMAALRHE